MRRRIGSTLKFFTITLWLFLAGSHAALNVFAIPRFDAWTIDTGLPQNSVNGMLQTRDGYLWLATNGGLVRYDGVRFTVFDVANSPGIKSNRLTALFEDREGSLWIGTEDSGLSRYRDGRFTAYTTKDGLPNKSVAAIEGDERGRLWVLSGVVISQLADGRFTAIPPQGDPPLSRDSVWRSVTKEGITFYDRDGLQTFTEGRFVTYTTKDGLPSLHQAFRGFGSGPDDAHRGQQINPENSRRRAGLHASEGGGRRAAPRRLRSRRDVGARPHSRWHLRARFRAGRRHGHQHQINHSGRRSWKPRYAY